MGLGPLYGVGLGLTGFLGHSMFFFWLLEGFEHTTDKSAAPSTKITIALGAVVVLILSTDCTVLLTAVLGVMYLQASAPAEVAVVVLARPTRLDRKWRC